MGKPNLKLLQTPIRNVTQNLPLYVNASTFNQMNIMSPQRPISYHPYPTHITSPQVQQQSMSSSVSNPFSRPTPTTPQYTAANVYNSHFLLNPHLNMSSIPNVSFLNTSSCEIPTIAPSCLAGSSIANMPVAAMSGPLSVTSITSSVPNLNSLSNLMLQKTKNNHFVSTMQPQQPQQTPQPQQSKVINQVPKIIDD